MQAARQSLHGIGLISACCLVLFSASAPSQSLPGEVLSQQKISGSLGTLSDDTFSFGSSVVSVASIGDIDGDGVDDIAMGVPTDSVVGSSQGAVWILLMSPQGTVKAQQKINSIQGGFTGQLDYQDHFGSALAPLGDLDGDGVPDLAVGATGDDDGGDSRGAVWLLMLRPDGTVKSHMKISQTQGGFSGSLPDYARFGSSLTVIRDLDGDGVVDLAVGALGGGSGATEGAVWVLFLRADATVKAEQLITSGVGGFGAVLSDGAFFGQSLATLQDLDGDGVPEIAVGAPDSGAGGIGRGSAWILFLRADGTVKAHQEISDSNGGLSGSLMDGGRFGYTVASLGDFDHDGVGDLAVGANRDPDDIPGARGAIWLLRLQPDGTVKAESKINAIQGGLANPLHLTLHSLAALPDQDGDGFLDLLVGELFKDQLRILFLGPRLSIKSSIALNPQVNGLLMSLSDGGRLGSSMTLADDIDDDGIRDIAVGARLDDDGGDRRGAVWILQLDADCVATKAQKISSLQGGFTGSLQDNDAFGTAVAYLGDLDGDGVSDLAVGATQDDAGFPFNPNYGAVWILFLNRDGTVKAEQKINAIQGGFTGLLNQDDQFGWSLTPLGDLDGDGVGDLAVGARGDDDGGLSRGAVWILFLQADGSVKSHTKISSLSGGFGGVIDDGDHFGCSLALLEPDSANDAPSLVVGAYGDDDGGANQGAVWILSLQPDGTVAEHWKISATSGGFIGALDPGDHFGCAVSAPGDLDGDGRQDLVVGACRDDDGGADRGAVYSLFLDGNESVLSHTKLSATMGGFSGVLDDDDRFGSAIVGLGDIDGDGRPELAVGAPLDDDKGPDRGAVWVLSLNAAVWTDLGLGLPGSGPAPHLSGVGSLVGGIDVALNLRAGPVNALTTLVVGMRLAHAPFLGGTLVPAPELLVSGLLTGPGGSLTVEGRWPSGVPTHTDVFFQTWSVDASAPAGFAASNGLAATTP